MFFENNFGNIIPEILSQERGKETATPLPPPPEAESPLPEIIPPDKTESVQPHGIMERIARTENKEIRLRQRGDSLLIPVQRPRSTSEIQAGKQVELERKAEEAYRQHAEGENPQSREELIKEREHKREEQIKQRERERKERLREREKEIKARERRREEELQRREREREEQLRKRESILRETQK